MIFGQQTWHPCEGPGSALISNIHIASNNTMTSACDNKDNKNNTSTKQDQRKPFEFSADATDGKGGDAGRTDETEAGFVAALTKASKLRAQTVKKAYLSVNDAKFEALSVDYLAWRQALCTGFAGTVV